MSPRSLPAVLAVLVAACLPVATASVASREPVSMDPPYDAPAVSSSLSAESAGEAPSASASSEASESAEVSAAGSASGSARPGACAPPDRGWGRYRPYERIEGARVSLPVFEPGEPVPERFDVYVHFHASDAARRGFVHEAHPAVFVGVDLGATSGAYRRAYSERGAFEGLLTRVLTVVRAQVSERAQLGRVVLSSWSAGFGATARIIKLFPERIHGLVLLDSLYAPYGRDERGEERPGTVLPEAAASTLALARRALRGERVVFLTYSEVPTIGYASTGQVAAYLRQRLGVREEAVGTGDDPRGQVSTLDRAGLHLRGFRGSDAQAHCRHLGLAGQAARWIWSPLAE